MVADREPVEREGEFLGRLRRRRADARSASSAQRADERDGLFIDALLLRRPFTLSDDPSAHGASSRDSAHDDAVTAPARAIEIQTSAANATGVFMLLCVVTMT